MRRLLRPDVAKLLLFAAFLLIAAAGHVQSEGFSDGTRQEQFLPKIPFCEAWMLLLAPYAVIAAAFRGPDGSKCSER